MVNDNTKEALPVHGYSAQPTMTVDLVNRNKILEERVLRQLDELRDIMTVDQRWLAIARTNIEMGFMAANRALFQPSRIALPEDEQKETA